MTLKTLVMMLLFSGPMDPADSCGHQRSREECDPPALDDECQHQRTREECDTAAIKQCFYRGSRIC